MEESDDQEDELLFESAHLAFRCNPDYLMLMKHLSVLFAKRIQVQSDIHSITKIRREDLGNPMDFVEQLKQGSLNLPSSIEVPKIPFVDITKYKENGLTNHGQPEARSSNSEKPQSVNFWTANEQRRLEELLHEFPPEDVESQRFAKIAKAMGNRTPKQIASRVQKFFKKLHDANLPIPGTSSNKSLRSRNQKSRKQKFKLERPSTFFPERNIPNDLLMKDDSGGELNASLPTGRDDYHQKVVALLKKVRQAKLEVGNLPTSYSGCKCTVCDDELQIGRRWICTHCESSENYCSDCFVSKLLENNFKHVHHDMSLF